MVTRNLNKHVLFYYWEVISLAKDKKNGEKLLTVVSIVATIMGIIIGIMGMNKVATVININGNVEITTIADDK